MNHINVKRRRGASASLSSIEVDHEVDHEVDVDTVLISVIRAMRVATSAEKFRATLNRVLLSDGLTIQSTEDLAKTREESSDLKRGMEEAKEVLRRTNKESEEQHRSETKRLRTIIEEYMRLHRPCPPGSVLEDLQTLSSTGQGITAIEREEAWGRMTGTIMSHRAVQEGPYAELEKPLDDQELVHGLEEWRDRCRDPVGLVLFGRILGGDTNQGFIRSAEGHDASLLPSNEASGTRIHPADVRQEFETFWQDLSNPVTGPQGIVPATLDNLDVFNSISFIRIMIVLVDVTCQPRLGGGVASLVSLVPLLCPKGENANGSFSQDSIDDWVNDVNSRTGTQGKNDPVIIGIIRNLPERRGTDMASAYWSMYSINFANRHVALYDWYEDWEISDIRSLFTSLVHTLNDLVSEQPWDISTWTIYNPRHIFSTRLAMGDSPSQNKQTAPGEEVPTQWSGPLAIWLLQFSRETTDGNLLLRREIFNFGEIDASGVLWLAKNQLGYLLRNHGAVKKLWDEIKAGQPLLR